MSNFSDLTKGARDFACGLYTVSPASFSGEVVDTFLYLLWDDFCDYPDNPNGLPPQPSSEFEGGQCECVLYKFPVFVNGQFGDTPRVYGAITGLRTRYAFPVSEPSGNALFEILCRGNVDTGCVPQSIWIAIAQGSNVPRGSDPWTIGAIVRHDGQPDTCGDSPKKFPPPSLTIPPGGFTSPPSPIPPPPAPFNIDIEFNFTPPPPPLPSPGNFLPPIVINFNKIGADFKIPIAFNFNGEINLDFGGGAGGGGGGGDFNFNQDDRDNIENIKNTTNNTNNTTNNTNNNVDNFYGDYKKDRDRTINKEPLPDDFDPPKPPELPGEKQVERLAFVEVDLTVVPSNAKTQSGKGAPNVIYAGWFEFRRKGKSLPRDYIHFANNCFVAPIGADGYAFTLYNGYQGTAVAITFKE